MDNDKLLNDEELQEVNGGKNCENVEIFMARDYCPSCKGGREIHDFWGYYSDGSCVYLGSQCCECYYEWKRRV